MPPPDIAPHGTELPLDGTQIGGSISAPGETDIYTFNLTHESKIYFDSLSPHSDVKWELQTADGQALFGRTFDQSDAFGMGNINALLPLQAGSYKLVVSSIYEQGTDDYAFRLMDVDAVASHDLILDGGPLLNQHLARGDQTDIYQFNATEGTHYVVGGPGDGTVEGALFWRLFDPQGHQIWTGTQSPSDELTFQQTGTYTLMVEGNVERTESVAYNAYVFTPQDRQIALPADGQVHGFLDSPDQVNTYTFTLTEHSALFFDGHLNSNGPYFDWTLQGQGGTSFTGNTRQDGSGLMELDAGSYTLTIRGQDHASGWYDFRLINSMDDTAPMLPLDTTWGGSLMPGFNSTLYHFEIQSGAQYSITLNTFDQDWISYDPARWMLIDPQGHLALNGVAGTTTDYNFSEGTWSLLLVGRQYNWTNVDYTLSVTGALPA
jgi:hypothetical protein